MRKNVYVSCDIRGTSPEATATLNQLCRHIDTIIQKAPLRTKAKAPFEVELDKTTVATGEEVTLKVTPEKPDIPFSVHFLPLAGAKLEVERSGAALKSDEPRICTFSIQTPGECLIKVWVCEKSGMVWTFYIKFNVVP